jgi:hypothetical protein
MQRLRTWIRGLLTLHGTPRGIAGGFALGVGLSLIPVPFLGMVLALAAAPVVRANVPATYLGTAVINPFTGVVFYFGELWLGTLLLGAPAAELGDAVAARRGRLVGAVQGAARAVPARGRARDPDRGGDQLRAGVRGGARVAATPCARDAGRVEL